MLLEIPIIYLPAVKNIHVIIFLLDFLLLQLNIYVGNKNNPCPLAIMNIKAQNFILQKENNTNGFIVPFEDGVLTPSCYIHLINTVILNLKLNLYISLLQCI